MAKEINLDLEENLEGIESEVKTPINFSDDRAMDAFLEGIEE